MLLNYNNLQYMCKEEGRQFLIDLVLTPKQKDCLFLPTRQGYKTATIELKVQPFFLFVTSHFKKN